MDVKRFFARGGRDGVARRAVTAEEGRAERLDPAAEREALPNLVLALWRVFADGFRADERAHEERDFRAAAAGVEAALAALPAERAPDPALCRRLIAALVAALPERLAALHERIDLLADTCRNHEKELNVLKLATSWQTDEAERCRAMIVEGLRGREAVLPMPGPDGVQPLLSDLLAALLHVRRPPPPTVAHAGRRQAAPAAAATAADPSAPPPSEGATVARILRETLAGASSVGRLARVLEDRELAQRLADQAAENRRYRTLLVRIGLLPRPGDGEGAHDEVAEPDT